MRESKFRAISAEELVSDDQWLIGFGIDYAEMVDGSTEAYLYTTHGVYEVVPETVGQFIGIKDSNDAEICEGDRFSLGSDVGTIVYMNGAFRVDWDEPYTWGIDRLIYMVHDKGEVVGNIHAKN